MDESVPDGLKKLIIFPPVATAAADASGATLRVEPVKGEPTAARWVYALVAPFPTFTDGVTLAELQSAWRGDKTGLFEDRPILASASTVAAMSTILGEPGDAAVRVIDADKILDTAWSDKVAWAVVPFEALEPRWKALQVDGLSPMDHTLNLDAYPLVVSFGLRGNSEALAYVSDLASKDKQSILPATNRDPGKMTQIIMTGTTALVRATADRMEKKGIDYPAQDIINWLRDTDFLHISNEISFDPDCKTPNASDPSLFFCSNPKYIGLLQYIHANIIDMTGNHLNDFGRQWLVYTMDMYRQNGMMFYASGENSDKARAPITFEHNGNKFAFLGCNPSGPQHVWATATEAGAAKCDYDWMVGEIKQLRSQGYLVIVTFQYYESYDPMPSPQQKADFRKMTDAGAVIVSGSQAHRPQAMEFTDNGFIHYGLGNLFFDQMDVPHTGTRTEFIDRHVFYDGRYIGTVLMTAMLEDYAKPRPTTTAERNAMLTESFKVSGWGQ
jgi:poly-gamma-glutamate synthesis protein (capsule biosynthesis protein)